MTLGGGEKGLVAQEDTERVSEQKHANVRDVERRFMRPEPPASAENGAGAPQL